MSNAQQPANDGGAKRKDCIMKWRSVQNTKITDLNISFNYISSFGGGCGALA